jgi:two-component system phosphate regulon sensor histidine kinase PhoR
MIDNKRQLWLLHPVSVFIFSIVALGLSLFLYIRWYLQATEAFQLFVVRYKLNPEQVAQGQTWVVVLVMSLLVAIILLGMLLIFIYYQKVFQLYRQQQNFINGFTHELKTPLTSLKLYLDTFKLHNLPPQEQSKYLNIMSADVDRLKQNVEGILNLGRLESNMHKAEFQRMELGSFLRDLIGKEAAQFTKAEILFENNPADYFWTLVDVQTFPMLVKNLIRNAINHNHQARPIVRISLVKQKNKIAMTFADNGIGLEKNNLKKIFRKFFQVGKTTKGTGLGLYMVATIAKLHRAEVLAMSPGLEQGTTFVVLMPASELDGN